MCRDGTRKARQISAGAVEKEKQVQDKDRRSAVYQPAACVTQYILGLWIE